MSINLENGYELTDNDVLKIIEKTYQNSYNPSLSFLQINSWFGQNTLLQIFNSSIKNKIINAKNVSENIFNSFVDTYGDASVGGIKEDFDNIKANLFSESDNINGIKLLEYILAQLDPDTYSSLNGLSNDTFDFSNSIGNRMIPISTIEDVDKVLTVDVDGTAKWLEPIGGSGGVPNTTFLSREDIPIYILTADARDDSFYWSNMTEIDCGEWK